MDIAQFLDDILTWNVLQKWISVTMCSYYLQTFMLTVVMMLHTAGTSLQQKFKENKLLVLFTHK